MEVVRRSVKYLSSEFPSDLELEKSNFKMNTTKITYTKLKLIRRNEVMIFQEKVSK